MLKMGMIEYIEIDEVLSDNSDLPLVDVRSPSEYRKGHIPGAINIPLFDDVEREKVGTMYHNSGREAAIYLGLDISGKKMSSYLKELKKHVKSGTVIMHCWRGGMRSASLAWLFNFAGGYDVKIISGGYKAYRKYIRNSFSEKARIVILGGKTGSGKTDVLNELEKKGYQVLNLEYIAKHKGSAFGSIAMPEQDTNEQFENNLFQYWQSVDKTKIVFTEDESRSIGSVSIPDPLFRQMRSAPVIFLDVDKDIRIKRLVDEYVTVERESLIKAVHLIQKRLGSENFKKVTENIRSESYDSAADILLGYYDKAYMKGLSTRDKSLTSRLHVADDLPCKTANMILEYMRKVKLFEE